VILYVAASNAANADTMGLSESVLKAIRRKGYRLPTPIQRKTLPLILQVGGCASRVYVDMYAPVGCVVACERRCVCRGLPGLPANRRHPTAIPLAVAHPPTRPPSLRRLPAPHLTQRPLHSRPTRPHSKSLCATHACT
jgi:hypothetical protein